MTMQLSTSFPVTALITHLVQSTAFAGVAWLLALALNRYPARVRFWVWMSASIKFLFPFALLTSLGARLAKPHPVHSALYTLIEEFNQPFAKAQPPALGPVTSTHSLQGNSWLVWILAAVWVCGFFLMLLRWARQWRSAHRIVSDGEPLCQGPEIDALRSGESEARIRRPIPVVVTSEAVEPGVFGIVRPVLMWPNGLSEQLEDVHIGAIVAHELEHVRRLDNLTSALHRIVQALFWFHPLVYWVGARMSEERERACDESVIARRTHPETYAESILKVCAFCLESPLPCVAGVSGSDLKKRVLRITKDRSGLKFTLGGRVLLASAALLAISLPIGFGVVHGQAAQTADAAIALPAFDVVSIKTHKDEGAGMMRMGISATPDGVQANGVPLQMLVRQAFGVSDDRILNEPDWVKSARFDLEAKVTPEDAPALKALSMQERFAMFLPVLEDRFGLKFHHEKKDLVVYALVVAKGGPKLKEATPADGGKGDHPASGGTGAPPPPPMPPGGGGEAASRPGLGGGSPARGQGMMMRMSSTQGMTLNANETPIASLAQMISQQISATVVDKTGLTGNYDFTLLFMPDMAMGTGPMMRPPQGAPPPDGAQTQEPAGPSIFTAVQEQLGLKLVAQKESVDVIVIDQIEQPTAN